MTRSRSLEEQSPVFAFARPRFGTGVNKSNEVSQVHSGRKKILFNLLSARSLSRGCHAGKKYFFLTTTIRALALGHAGGRLVEYTNSALTAWGRTQKKRELHSVESKNDGEIFLFEKPALELRKKQEWREQNNLTVLFVLWLKTIHLILFPKLACKK